VGDSDGVMTFFFEESKYNKYINYKHETNILKCINK